jgi:hypothetical protein
MLGLGGERRIVWKRRNSNRGIWRESGEKERIRKVKEWRNNCNSIIILSMILSNMRINYCN